MQKALSSIRSLVINRSQGTWLAGIFATMLLLMAALLVQLVEVTWIGGSGS
jgi:hypothetical protein